MKFRGVGGEVAGARVAPHWGAWIEMSGWISVPLKRSVAPHWGAWIEISRASCPSSSPPVAPHWGAWIEISVETTQIYVAMRRTPLGCVD